MIGDSCIWKVVYIIWLDNPEYNLRLSQPNRASIPNVPDRASNVTMMATYLESEHLAKKRLPFKILVLYECWHKYRQYYNQEKTIIFHKYFTHGA